MFGRTTRTCAAGLRHFVRPATCKRSPLMGFEVPNVTWATPFLFLLFIFPHLSFQSHISPFFQFSQPRGLFQTPEAAYNCISFLFGFTAPQPTASCAAEPFSFMPKWLSVCVCVWNSVTKSPFHLYRIARDHRGLVNEDSPGKPVQTYLPFFQTVWQPGSAEELDTVII